MIATLFLLALVLSATGLPVVHGPVVNSLGTAPFVMKMSKDASIIIVSYAALKDVEVFKNNGHGF